mmetsp:Transcript_25196/g.34836  ORF Transcript_25196/g.34836 Transcript_25196/m.34836 type:complete len:121 (+) Transcript_25196:50-412(+)
MTLTSQFQLENTFEKRALLSKKILEQHQDRIPVIVEKRPGSQISEIEKTKFLAPDNISVAQFMVEIRKHISMNQDQSLFLFVGEGTMPQPSSLMSEVYIRHKDEDGFLYFFYSGENVFGN